MTDNEKLMQAIRERHSIRKYRSQPLPPETVSALQERIDEINRKTGLHIQLVINERRAFTGMLAYGKFKGVENYIVMAGKKGKEVDEAVGYYGEELVLLAQTLGLGSCWVGLTYRKVKDAYQIPDGEKIRCVIAFGYAEGEPASHKIKTVNEVSNASASTPDWFQRGVEAALLAPTAINQQKFFFEYVAPVDGSLPTVIARRGFSLAGYTRIDLGIAKLHFEIAAGKDSFQWG